MLIAFVNQMQITPLNSGGEECKQNKQMKGVPQK